MACETPTEEYYSSLKAYMKAKHPNASVSMLEHCEALEVFLEISILTGFSFGADNALVGVQMEVPPRTRSESNWLGAEWRRMPSH